MKQILVPIMIVLLALLVACGEAESDSTESDSTESDSTYFYEFVPPAEISGSASSPNGDLDTSFPSQQSAIQSWVKAEYTNNNVVRSHSWNIWGALTSLTDYAIENPDGAPLGSEYLPAFMTWYSSYELYGVNSAANNTCTATREGTVDENDIKRCRAGSLLDFNKFSLVETEYILSQEYNELSTLTQRVNNDPTPLDLPPFASSQFENNTNTNVSISLKPVYYLLKNNAHNLLPYWGGQLTGTSSNPSRPTPNTWNQCVLVTIGETSSEPPTTCNPGAGNANVPMPNGGWHSVPLSDFLAIPLTQEMLDELVYASKSSPIQASSILSLGYTDDDKPTAGDVAVLVAMHVTVRETQDWVWQTMYWSPVDLPPVGSEGVQMNTGYPVFPPQTDAYVAGPNYPGSSFDNPYGDGDNASGSVPTWAKNYAMCTAYSTVYPVQPRVGGSNDGTFPQICYNPWLETAFDKLPGYFSDSGLNSNCMSCHGQASYNGAAATPTTTCSESQGFGYYGNGYISRDASCLTNKNFVYDFSWHIANAYSSQSTANEGVIHQKPPIISPSFSK